MKVLLTGGAGFIGSHLCDAYVARGDQVLVLDDFSAGREQNIEHLKSNIHVEKLSILDKNAVNQCISDFKPDLINHHAAQKSVRESVNNPQLDAEINLIGVLNILEAARKTDCRKVVFASSGGVVYGEQNTFPATEEHSFGPVSPYGVSKLATEFYLNFYVQQWGFQAACLRYANVYGPRQDPHGEAGVVAIFSEKLYKKEPVIIYGDGEQTRDFVYVKDVVQANLKVESALDQFAAFNVSTAVESSVNILYSTLCDISGRPNESSNEPLRDGEQKRSCLSFDLICRSTGWKPEFDLKSGLTETYEWFQSHL